MTLGTFTSLTPDHPIGINKVNVSTYTMSKTVTHGVHGFARALFYDSTVLIPEDQPFVQTEGPTGYMPGNFSSFYSINLQNGSVTPIPHQPSTSGTTQDPLV